MIFTRCHIEAKMGETLYLFFLHVSRVNKANLMKFDKSKGGVVQSKGVYAWRLVP